MRKLCLLALAALLIAPFGCQQQKTNPLDEPIAINEPEEEKPTGLAAILPWNWGKGEAEDDQPQNTRTDVEFEEDQQGGVLEALAFWTWFESDEPKPVTLNDVLFDMSPELSTRAETHDESRVRQAHVVDTDTRTFWDDVNRALLLDRPSRLTLYPNQ